MRNPDIQCVACGTSGHHVGECRILPLVQGCLEYIASKPTEAQDLMRAYRKSQHPDARRMARDVIKVLRARLQDGTWDAFDDDEDIADRIASEYSDEDYVAPIFHLRAEQQEPAYCQYTEDNDFSVIHPVKMPSARTLTIPRTSIPMMSSPTPTLITLPPHQHHLDAHPLTVTCVTSSRMDMRRDLADTGASVSATGMRHILHQFTSNTLYEIMGYDGAVTKAAGQGIAKIYNAQTQTTEPMFFVYVPSIDGNIISLEHHARTHPRIHRWAQDATPATNSGQVTFYDVDDNVVSTYPTILEKGLYYIQTLDFIPVPEHVTHICRTQEAQDHDHDAETVITKHTVVDGNLNCIDFDMPLQVQIKMAIIQGVSDMPEHSICTAVKTVALPTPGSANRMEKDVLNYETWHQRFAHCSEKRLRLTQQHVDGIPSFHHTSIPHVVKCRACDVAKLRKAPRGGPTPLSPNIVNGQIFHMDIGFFRGPANLQEVLARTQDAQPKIIESRQGYVCYLLIVDAKSRYVWAFPMKSKAVPPHFDSQIFTHPRACKCDDWHNSNGR